MAKLFVLLVSLALLGAAVAQDNVTSADNYGLTVTCTSEYMEARLDSNKHSGIRSDTIALEDRNCKVTRSEGGFLYFKTSLDGCGTKHNTTENEIVYYNSIFADTGMGSNNVKISRALQAEFPFKCTYPRSAILSVVSFSPRRKVIYTRTSDYGNFTFAMDLYESGKYENKHEDYPITVKLNEDLYVEVQVQSNDSKLALFVDDCWATPSDDRDDENAHKIISEGCIKDNTAQYTFENNTATQKFSVKAFRFISGRTNDVFLHCKVEVCREGDENSNCAVGCRTDSRKRRSLTSDASSETLTIGSIRIAKGDRSQSATASTTSFATISIIAGVLGLLVIGLVALLVVIFKKRQAVPANVVFKKVAADDGDRLMMA